MKRLAIALVLAACGGKSEETPPSTESGSAPAGSATAKPAGSGSAPAGSASGSGSAVAAGSGSGSAAPVAAKDPELPTPEDFEEDSATKITEKNLETEVKAIEKEIGEN